MEDIVFVINSNFCVAHVTPNRVEFVGRAVLGWVLSLLSLLLLLGLVMKDLILQDFAVEDKHRPVLRLVDLMPAWRGRLRISETLVLATLAIISVHSATWESATAHKVRLAGTIYSIIDSLRAHSRMLGPTPNGMSHRPELLFYFVLA